MRHRGALCCLTSLAVLTTLAWGQNSKTAQPKPFDWPQWQGPDRTNVSKETDLLKSWPTGGPPIAWTTKNLGVGYSTVAVAAGRIYTMGGKGNDEFIIALDEVNGKEVWRTRVGDYLKQDRGDGPRCTPTVDGDLVFALTGTGELACVDTAGKLHWHKSLSKEFGGRMMSNWGWSESPLVDGDKVICTPGSDTAVLAALNKKTGATIWKAPMAGGGGSGHASVVVSEGGGIRQYITWLGTCLVSVAAKDGKILWKYAEHGIKKTANIPTAIIDGDLVFCSAGYGWGSALLKLEADGSGVKCTEQYFLEAKTLQNHHGGLVLVDGYVYGGNGNNQGNPTCIEFKTGKVAWKDRGAGQGSAAITCADGHIYFRHQDGTMSLVEANPASYKETGKFKLPNDSGKPSWPHPVVANGKLYIRDQDVLMCFDVKAKTASAK